MIKTRVLLGLLALLQFLSLVISKASEHTASSPTRSPASSLTSTGTAEGSHKSDISDLHDLVVEHGVWIGVGFGFGVVVSGLLFYVASLAKLCEYSEFLIQDHDLPSDSQISRCRYRLGTEDYEKVKGGSIEKSFSDTIHSDNEINTIYTPRTIS